MTSDWCYARPGFALKCAGCKSPMCLHDCPPDHSETPCAERNASTDRREVDGLTWDNGSTASTRGGPGVIAVTRGQAEPSGVIRHD